MWPFPSTFYESLSIHSNENANSLIELHFSGIMYQQPLGFKDEDIFFSFIFFLFHNSYASYSLRWVLNHALVAHVEDLSAMEFIWATWEWGKQWIVEDYEVFKKICTPSPSLFPHKLFLRNKIEKKLAMNNKRMTKKTMSNRRTRKTMSNTMVANWVHNLPEIDVKGLKRHSKKKSLKFQSCLVFWVWNFRTELETPQTWKLIAFFEHKSLKKQETQKKLKLPPTSFNFFKKKKTPYTLTPKLNS